MPGAAMWITCINYCVGDILPAVKLDVSEQIGEFIMSKITVDY